MSALRFEAHAHDTRELRCGRLLPKFTAIVNPLKAMLEAFLDPLQCCVHICFIADDTLDRLSTAVQLGNTREGGIDLNKSRLRAAL